MQVQYNSSGVLVRYTDGTTAWSVYARSAVVTLPLGVLKASAASLFSPALSSTKTTAISSLGMGTLDKIILIYSSAWWPSSWGCGCPFATFARARFVQSRWPASRGSQRFVAHA